MNEFNHKKNPDKTPDKQPKYYLYCGLFGDLHYMNPDDPMTKIMTIIKKAIVCLIFFWLIVGVVCYGAFLAVIILVPLCVFIQYCFTSLLSLFSVFLFW
ncbi:MAG: hypothetical protein LBP59_06085 [Planctomycetaceae bacterium]|jgi:hypothetical protein|nr:hypothetical protein [Planctomycetaceae bacterium]